MAREIMNTQATYSAAKSVAQACHRIWHAIEWPLYAGVLLGAPLTPDRMLAKYAPPLYHAHMLVVEPVAHQYERMGLEHPAAHLAADFTLEALLLAGFAARARNRRRTPSATPPSEF